MGNISQGVIRSIEMEKYKSIFKENQSHYSDSYIEEFIKNGWKRSKTNSLNKNFQSKQSGGQLNPSGKIKVSISLDSSSRWVICSIGWHEAEWDGRNYIEKANILVKEIENEIKDFFNGKKTKFANKQK